jgi:hypothetical protein
MSLKRTILIVKSNPDDLRKAKEELIKKEQEKKQLVKYSDYAVETKAKLFIFKVVPLPRQVLDQIRGYTEVDAADLLTDLEKFVEEVRNVCKSHTKTPSTPASNALKATGSPQQSAGNDNDEEDPNKGQEAGEGDK